jgi:VIT1/CCC1 family predicted Fe2+/Mn2+ transporter
MINLNNCISDELTWNDESLKEVYSKLVMGFNPEELGSPILAALSSFLLFVTGAIGPILPWLCFSGIKATITSVLITVTIGICVGGYVSYSSGKKIWKGAIEQVLIIGLSSIVTYGLGYILR